MKIITFILSTFTFIAFLQRVLSTESTSKASASFKTLANSAIFESIEKYKNKKVNKASTSNIHKKEVLNSAVKPADTTPRFKSTVSNTNSNTNKNSANPSFTNTASIVDAMSKSKADTLGTSNRAAGTKDFFGESTKRTLTNVLNPGDIHWEGWVRFYTFSNLKDDDLVNMTGQMPFYSNNYFQRQLMENKDIDVKEMQGDDYANVPDNSSFYMTVFDRFSTFSLSRKVSIIYNIIKYII